MISDADERRKPEYWGKRKKSSRLKRVDMIWIWSVYSFGDKFWIIAVSSNRGFNIYN